MQPHGRGDEIVRYDVSVHWSAARGSATALFFTANRLPLGARPLVLPALRILLQGRPKRNAVREIAVHGRPAPIQDSLVDESHWIPF